MVERVSLEWGHLGENLSRLVCGRGLFIFLDREEKSRAEIMRGAYEEKYSTTHHNQAVLTLNRRGESSWANCTRRISSSVSEAQVLFLPMHLHSKYEYHKRL